MKASIFLLCLLILSTYFVQAQQSGSAMGILTPDELSSLSKKQEQSIPVSTGSNFVSRLSSVNLISGFGDTKAEIRLGTATLVDATGLQAGTAFSVTWRRRISKIPNPTALPIKDIVKWQKLIDEYRTKKNIDPALNISFDDLDPEFRSKVLNSCIIDPKAFKSPWFLSVQYTVGRNNFDYITDTLATRPLSDKKTNKSFAFTLSKFQNQNLFYAFIYSVSYNYRSGDDIITYAFPVGKTGVQYMKDVTVGTPIEKIESRLKAELRQLFRDEECRPIVGINPSISTLFRSEKINIDFPVYFLTKTDTGLFNGLQAGFKIGYTSKWDDSFWRDFGSFSSEKMYFGLFLSKPFDLQP
jgi:hypothetical protein